jgi:membrane protein YqaA with SNARE-associated domain
MGILAGYGIAGLFVSAFLAATILPFSSELILGALLTQGVSPQWCLLAATSGNVLGSVVNYMMGFWGSQWVFHRVLRMSDVQKAAAQDRFKKWGTASLLFAWVPVVGDPLTVAAGVLRVHFGLFFVLVGIGKCLRYVAVIYFFKLI